MALPTLALINAAVNNIFAAAADDKTRAGARKVVSDLNRMLDWLAEVYSPIVDVALTDATDAGVAEAIAADGELGLAFAAAFPEAAKADAPAFPVGGVFVVQSVNDFTDDALATAKGGAVADNDVFQVSGADAVTYLGNQSADIDFADEREDDFVSIGS